MDHTREQDRDVMEEPHIGRFTNVQTPEGNICLSVCKGMHRETRFHIDYDFQRKWKLRRFSLWELVLILRISLFEEGA